MSMWGADVESLESLGSLMDQKADELAAIHRLLSRQLHAAPWNGPSADQFRSQWSSVHGKALLDSSGFLRDAAKVVHDNARQQRNASAAGTGGAGGSGGHPIGGPGGLESRYDATRKQIEDRKAYLRREIERLEGKRDEGGLMELAGDINPFARSKSETRHDEITALRRELESLEGLRHLDRRQILMIDGKPGDQRIVEVHGNLETAKKVIIHVPGINTDLGDYKDGHSNARNLYEEARAVYGDDVAVVSFADYNIPDDLVEAASTQGAETGAAQLRAFVGQLHDMGYKTGDISVVAHSYGSTLTGHAMQDGLDVGRVVVLGSPGMGGNDRASLGSPDVDLWAASAPLNVTSGDQGLYTAGGVIVGGIVGGFIAAGDPVSWAPAHGESPAADGFGAHRFDVPDAHGHSAYFDDGSASLENIARLATGRPPR